LRADYPGERAKASVGFFEGRNAELIAAKMVAQAIKGSASKHLAEYVEGAPRQAFDANLSVIDELADRIAKARQRMEAYRKEKIHRITARPSQQGRISRRIARKN
jgi:hypothetical protein